MMLTAGRFGAVTDGLERRCRCNFGVTLVPPASAAATLVLTVFVPAA